MNLRETHDNLKIEVIGGIEMMSPPAYSNHNAVKNNIYHVFISFLKDNVCIPIGDGEKLILDNLGDKDYLVPDFFVICDRSKYRADAVYGSPDLVAEVLSPGTAVYDRGEKKDIYQGAGVKEYWIADPNNKSIEVYLLMDGFYRLDMIYRIAEDYESDEDKAKAKTKLTVNLFPHITVDLNDIFRYVNIWNNYLGG